MGFRTCILLFCEACPSLGNEEVSTWGELVVANDRFGILGSCNHFYVLTKMILGDMDGYSFHPSYHFKRTWQWGGFSGVFAEIGSSWVPYTTFRAVPILASNSGRYSYSKNDSPLSRGVANSPHHWYAESATPRITDTESRLLNFLKENFLYRWYGEWSTPRISDTVSRWLPVSLSRRVADSPTQRYAESAESTTLRICDTGVAIQRKN